MCTSMCGGGVVCGLVFGCCAKRLDAGQRSEIPLIGERTREYVAHGAAHTRVRRTFVIQ